jgi:hypothetical protein
MFKVFVTWGSFTIVDQNPGELVVHAVDSHACCFTRQKPRTGKFEIFSPDFNLFEIGGSALEAKTRMQDNLLTLLKNAWDHNGPTGVNMLLSKLLEAEKGFMFNASSLRDAMEAQMNWAGLCLPMIEHLAPVDLQNSTKTLHQVFVKGDLKLAVPVPQVDLAGKCVVIKTQFANNPAP